MEVNAQMANVSSEQENIQTFYREQNELQRYKVFPNKKGAPALTRPVLLGYTIYRERKPLVTVGFPNSFLLRV